MPLDPTQDPAQAPPDSIVLDSFDGLKNTVEKERLGPRDLLKAVNVDIDDAGQLRRRRGYTQVGAAGNYHSPFVTYKGEVLIVKDGMLALLHRDYSVHEITAILGSDPSTGVPPLAYAQVGPTVYYTGLSDSGKVDLETLTASPWGSEPDLWLSPVVDPTATLPQVRGTYLGKPPNATALAYYNGRIFLARGRTLWATRLYNYDWIDKTDGYKFFEADITMIGAVSDGVYVGTEEGLWWLSGVTQWSGTDWAKLKRRRVMDSPVIPGSMVMIPGELGNPPQVSLKSDTPVQIALMFMTASGVCVAGDGGQTTNLTESKVFFPNSVSAAALYRRQDGANTYLVVTQNGGTPADNAAVGDYVEATLIKRDTWRELNDRTFFKDAFVPVWS